MIEVQGLTKRFGETTAVDDLTFSVEPGIVTGFLGPNGAGKSTTMRMILGLDRPDAGRALVSGRSYASLPAPLYDVGALLDAKDVHGGRSARSHLKALAQSNGISTKRVDEVLDMTGIASVGNKRIKGFSLGMSQRLGIAAALLGDPQVLLLDEPVNGLDPEGILWIRNFLKYLASQGRTVFVSSHLMSEMALTADHLIVIGRGRLMADTTTSAFIEQNSARVTRVRSPRADDLLRVLTERGFAAEAGDEPGVLEVSDTTSAAVGELAAEHGVTLHELYEHRASLETAFMELTRESVDYHAEVGAPAAAAPANEEAS